MTSSSISTMAMGLIRKHAVDSGRIDKATDSGNLTFIPFSVASRSGWRNWVRSPNAGDGRAVEMSASLLVLIPPAVLAAVLLLCFVGCATPTFRVRHFTEYSTATILPTPGLVGYWPLGEAAGATIAADLKSGHNGSYLSRVFPDEPAFPSAAAPER